eukprot:CAMPEP_0117569604 /NCGR_PEP_ID=MMETSP0784-20121206/58748_1 /TAXON_ID=39447 /ORGANISM="" /LENGTH=544 /DNA_ID=CAMNT_0005367591 /DNA_START=65 /DNA_END=1695 /DNA_ORIENTATION=-
MDVNEPCLAPEAAAVPEVQDAVDHEAQVSASEIQKWGEMIDTGISRYMRQHPDRFHRRVRRGIPPRFRWQVWMAAVRMHDHELPQGYHDLSQRENAWTTAIEIDIARTFPDVKTFDNMQQKRLFRVLNAYASYNPDVGYCQGMNFVAGLLLLVSDCEEESFNVLVCLMDHVGLSGFYTDRLPLLRRYLRACDKLVGETVPELRDHFIRENVQPAVYLHQWFLTLFINCFPLSMVLIIWDVIVCEGLPVILRIAVSILQVLKDSLLSMHFEEIIRFFKMMKTYEDEDGELNAFRIGQLLMKHTEHVVIPDSILKYLTREPLDDDANLDSDESWEADGNGGSWLQSLSRMFAFGSTRRRSGDTREARFVSGGGLSNGGASSRATPANEAPSPVPESAPSGPGPPPMTPLPSPTAPIAVATPRAAPAFSPVTLAAAPPLAGQNAIAATAPSQSMSAPATTAFTPASTRALPLPNGAGASGRGGGGGSGYFAPGAPNTGRGVTSAGVVGSTSINHSAHMATASGIGARGNGQGHTLPGRGAPDVEEDR